MLTFIAVFVFYWPQTKLFFRPRQDSPKEPLTLRVRVEEGEEPIQVPHAISVSLNIYYPKSEYSLCFRSYLPA